MDLILAETGEEAELLAVEQIVTFDDVSCAKAKITCDRIVIYAGQARLLQAELPPLTRSLVRCGKRRTPVSVGRPAWEDLGSVGTLEGLLANRTYPQGTPFTLTWGVNTSQTCWYRMRLLRDSTNPGRF